jgi:transmembrane sensor
MQEGPTKVHLTLKASIVQMKPDSRDARQLLKKYLDGACTPEEAALLQTWYDQFSFPLTEEQIAEDPILEEQLHRATWDKINRAQSPVRRMNFRLVAAACLVGILIGSGLLLIFNNGSHRLARKSGLVREVNNTLASISKLVLPDGTQVWLNAHSRLSWQEDFSSGNRTVQLDGEGYFEVAKDAAHPFRVQSKNFITRVLGTAFNIECYSGEDRVRVALVTGSVQLSFTDNRIAPALLKPGQIGFWGEGSRSFGVEQGNALAYTSWRSGGFVLQNVPLELALRRLCRKYGYTLQEDFLENRQKPITATFTESNFEEILTDILYVNHLTYSIKDNIVTVQ